MRGPYKQRLVEETMPGRQVVMRAIILCGALAVVVATFVPGGCARMKAQAPRSVEPTPEHTALPAGSPLSWVQAATQTEVEVLQQQGAFSVRYRERKIDAKGDTTREIIEAKEGGVARLMERDGKPISGADDAAERERLQQALTHPDEFLRHHRRDDSIRDDSAGLVKLMPQAMLYSYAPGQPQLANATHPQVVLDFSPNPKFHPPSMLSDLLTGLAGRLWIDAEDKHVIRVEGRVLHPVNFGYGIVAHFYPGGTITFEQRAIGDGHWMYAQVMEHLMVRALMVKTIPEDVQMTSSEVMPLPKLLGYQDAIRELLAMPIPLQ